MTYTQAVTIRTLQLQGVDIGDKLLNEAIAVIKNTRTPTAWPEEGKREVPSGFGPFTDAQRAAMVPEDKSRPVFWCGNCGARNQ